DGGDGLGHRVVPVVDELPGADLGDVTDDARHGDGQAVAHEPGVDAGEEGADATLGAGLVELVPHPGAVGQLAPVHAGGDGADDVLATGQNRLDVLQPLPGRAVGQRGVEQRVAGHEDDAVGVEGQELLSAGGGLDTGGRAAGDLAGV